MYSTNHKTVFVLDHTPYFGIACEAPIDFDFIKSRSIIPIKPISKSLWTCSVESAIEYCRIVWDLFPNGKLIRFIASDSSSHLLNNWSSSQQSISFIMNGMTQISIPPPSRSANMPEHTVIHGLRNAITALSECTDAQWDKYTCMLDDEPKFVNRGRVVCITSARDDESMKRLEEIFHNVLHQQNQLCHSGKAEEACSVPIDYCHLVIINTYPISIESQVTNHPPRHLSSMLTTEVHSIKAPLISNKLSSLILDHYDLASTTVTGIPMKEEQNASSSANYDVEIYHGSSAHTSILKGNAADTAAIRTIKEGLEYETVTLKWCTPRSCSAAEMQNCTAMHRITPVDVNSRPSLCLINFLLNGRSVMLEMAKKSGGKITSHLLAAHGGEIFIHSLSTARSVLEDPPSISEGCGGRVTDYRIPDFGLFIKQNRLFPLKTSIYQGIPSWKMKERLERHTQYWPLTITSTLIFNLKAYIDPLPALITEEKITDEEVNKCKQVIYNIIGLESKHESLHLTNVGQKFKGQKREEQYKLIWKELETLIKKNQHTEQHKAIYNCLLECHKFNDADRVELEQAIRELDYYEQDALQRASVIRATTDSPMSPPPLSTLAASKNIARAGPMSLFDLFFSSQDSKITRPDFAGRQDGSVVAKLYPNLKLDNERHAKGEGKQFKGEEREEQLKVVQEKRLKVQQELRLNSIWLELARQLKSFLVWILETRNLYDLEVDSDGSFASTFACPPSSPPLAFLALQQQGVPNRKSLYQLYLAMVDKTGDRPPRPDFAGRQNGSLFAKLYPNFKEEIKETLPVAEEVDVYADLDVIVVDDDEDVDKQLYMDVVTDPEAIVDLTRDEMLIETIVISDDENEVIVIDD